MIKQIKEEDLNSIVDFHLEVLPYSIQSKFGKNFIRTFYRSLIQDPEFFCDGYFWNSRLIGFDAYSPHPWKVFRRTLRHNFLKYFYTIFCSVAKNPKLFFTLGRVLSVLFRVKNEPGKDIKAEAINWGVHPDYRRSSQFFKETEIHVSKEMHNNMINTMQKLKVKRIKIMPYSKDPKTTKFLKADGWNWMGQVNRWGDTLDVYVLDI